MRFWVSLMAALCFLFASAAFAGEASSQGAELTRPAPVMIVTIKPGGNFWQVWTSHDPKRDTKRLRLHNWRKDLALQGVLPSNIPRSNWMAFTKYESMVDPDAKNPDLIHPGIHPIVLPISDKYRYARLDGREGLELHEKRIGRDLLLVYPRTLQSVVSVRVMPWREVSAGLKGDPVVQESAWDVTQNFNALVAKLNTKSSTCPMPTAKPRAIPWNIPLTKSFAWVVPSQLPVGTVKEHSCIDSVGLYRVWYHHPSYVADTAADETTRTPPRAHKMVRDAVFHPDKPGSLVQTAATQDEMVSGANPGGGAWIGVCPTAQICVYSGSDGMLQGQMAQGMRMVPAPVEKTPPPSTPAPHTQSCKGCVIVGPDSVREVPAPSPKVEGKPLPGTYPSLPIIVSIINNAGSAQSPPPQKKEDQKPAAPADDRGNSSAKDGEVVGSSPSSSGSSHSDMQKLPLAATPMPTESQATEKRERSSGATAVQWATLALVVIAILLGWLRHRKTVKVIDATSRRTTT